MPAVRVKKNINTPLLINSLLLSTIIPLPASALDCTWAGGTGNWTDTNWTGCPGSSPTASDNATITTGSVTSNNSQSIQDYDQTSGILTGTGNLTVSGQTTLNGGSMSGDGTTRAEGGLLISGSFYDIQDNRSLVNVSGQTANWTSGNVRLFNTGSTLINETGAQFNINADGNSLYGNGLFSNQGDITVILSDVLQTTTISSVFNNQGSVDIQTGELRLAGPGNHSGSFTSSADGTLNFSGGTQTFNNDASITAENVQFSSNNAAGSFTIDGTYDVANTTVTGNSVYFNTNATTDTLNQTNGIIRGTGDLNVTGLTTLSGGSMYDDGTTRAEGGLLISGSFYDIQDNRTLVNVSGQTANWTSGNVRLFNTGSTLINETGAQFNINADGNSLYGNGLFSNQGDITVILSDVLQTTTISSVFNNEGSVDIQTGELRLAGPGNHSGSFTSSADGTLNFSGGTQTFNNDASITAENVQFSRNNAAGSFTINGIYDVTNTTVTGNSVYFNSNATTDTLNQTNGIIRGTGDLNVTGLTTLSGGSMYDDGTTRAEGGLLITGSFYDIQDNRSLVNVSGQTANWTSGNVRLFNTGSTLINETGAQFNINADGNSLYGNGLFSNQGDITVILSDVLQTTTISSVFNNEGSVDIQTGELRLAGPGNHSGSFTSSADGILNFSGGTQTFNNDASITAENVQFSSNNAAGSFTIDGTYDVANTTVSGNSVYFNTNATTDTLNQTNGIIRGTGDLNVTGLTTLSGGSMYDDGTTRAEGGLLITGSFYDIQDNRTLVNVSGQTANWTSGNVRLFNTGSTLINESGAQFNISGASRTQYGSGSFINDGTINVNTSDALQTISVADLSNNGTIDIQQGTLHTTNQNFSNNGTIRIADGARMSGIMNLTNSTTGLFTGDGTIDPATNFTFTNAGQINPGDAIGELTVNGDMEMLTSSIFNVELGGLDNFDLLTVTGDSTLDGTLNVFLTNNFTPTADQTFDILLTDVLHGTFSSVVGMNNPGFEWYVSYIINDEGQDIARLGVSAVPLPAAGWLLLSGLGLLVGLGRRTKA